MFLNINKVEPEQCASRATLQGTAVISAKRGRVAPHLGATLQHGVQRVTPQPQVLPTFRPEISITTRPSKLRSV